MWQRTSEPARRALQLARREAQALGYRTIEPEQVLLALLRDPGNVVTHILGASMEPVRKELKSPGLAIDSRANRPKGLSHRSKEVLRFAFEEAEKLDEAAIGPEHLLLGVIKEGGPACRTLARFGISLEEARRKLMWIQEGALPYWTATHRQETYLPFLMGACLSRHLFLAISAQTSLPVEIADRPRLQREILNSIFDESRKGIHALDPDDFGSILARAAEEAAGESIEVHHLLSAIMHGDDDALIASVAAGLLEAGRAGAEPE